MRGGGVGGGEGECARGMSVGRGGWLNIFIRRRFGRFLGRVQRADPQRAKGKRTESREVLGITRVFSGYFQGVSDSVDARESSADKRVFWLCTYSWSFFSYS